MLALLLTCCLAVVPAACVNPSRPPAASVPPSRPASVDLAEGGIEGRVTDASGNPIAGAAVTIETAEFSGTATTTTDGEFRASGVSGEFVITVAMLGYRSAVRRVVVAPGQLVTVELILEPEG